MDLFKKKQQPANAEVKCPVEGCRFTCNDLDTLKKHTDWKHPELVKTASKKK